MTIWSAASSVTSCPALLSSSGSSKTQHREQQQQPTLQQQEKQPQQLRSLKRVLPRTKLRDLVESSTDEFSSQENLSKAQTLRQPKRYIPRYITNNASPLSINSRNTLNSSNSNLSTLSKGSSFITAFESDCLSRRVATIGQRAFIRKDKEKIKAEGETNSNKVPTAHQKLQLPTAADMLKRTGSNGSNLSKSTGGLLILPRMSIESMTTNEMLHLAEEQTAISDKSPWNNPQTVLDGITSESPRQAGRTKSLQTVKSLHDKKRQETKCEKKILFGKNVLQFRPSKTEDGLRSSTYCNSLQMAAGNRSCTLRTTGTANNRRSATTLGPCKSNMSNCVSYENNMKQAESVILTVLQILYFYGTFFLGFGLLLVAYYLHD